MGEPLREAQKIGLDTPILKTIYELCRMIQWRLKEAKGLVKAPPKRVLLPTMTEGFNKALTLINPMSAD